MSSEDVPVQSDARNPFPDNACVLPCRHGLAGLPAACEQKFAGLLARRLEVVINGLAGLLRQFKSDRTPSLSLTHRRAGERIAVRGNVFDLQSDYIAASQLAIDGEIDYGRGIRFLLSTELSRLRA